MKILFATDGSEASQRAEALLTSIANRSSEVEVLSVVATNPHGPEAALFGMEAIAQIREHVEATASRSAARLQDAGFRAVARVVSGPPAETIVREGIAGAYDLTVLGAGSHRSLGRLLLGSTSFNVLHSSSLSVLIVHETPVRAAPLRVLVATDGSDQVQRAAAMLADLADPDRCRVTVLSVARTPIDVLVPFTPVTGSAESQLRSDVVEKADHVAERTAGDLRRRGFQCDTLALDGAPHGVIVDECESGDYDLVVVGSRGLGRMRRSVLGSVSDAVVRHARRWSDACPADRRTGRQRPIRRGFLH
jgi:nucleotide-binding universal stress UspA family protein